MKILDLGCGTKKTSHPSAQVIGVDRKAVPGVDVVHDLDAYPYPFQDSEFDMVFCNHIIEHLTDIMKVM